MAEFFSKYPKILYNKLLVTDILTRVALREKYTNKVQLYYEYNMQDGDTPEIIAAKYYGDPELNWIVLFMNEIIDPVYDFALSYNNFITYLDKKYGELGLPLNMSGSTYAKANLNPAPFSYQLEIISTDLDSGVIATNKMFIDEASYLGQNTSNPVFNFGSTDGENITYVKSKVYIYDYEYELNEKKRTIKLLQKRYVPQIIAELESLLKLKYN